MAQELKADILAFSGGWGKTEVRLGTDSDILELRSISGYRKGRKPIVGKIVVWCIRNPTYRHQPERPRQGQDHCWELAWEREGKPSVQDNPKPQFTWWLQGKRGGGHGAITSIPASVRDELPLIYLCVFYFSHFLFFHLFNQSY